MNILALNWNDLKNPYSGGAEVHLEELLQRLVEKGHRVTLLCSGYKGSATDEIVAGVRIVRCGNRFNFNLIVPCHLRQLIRENSFDVLIEDINKIPFYTPLYTRLKTLVVIPHLFATTVFQEVNPVLAAYVWLAELPVATLYKGRKINVISESTSKDIVARGFPQEDVSVIHCGIDHDLYSYDPGITKYDRPTVLYLGRIKKYKSVQHLIGAFSRVRSELPEARLVIVGRGDYLDALKSLADSLGLSDCIEFPGFVDEKVKIDLMRRSHVSVLPSPKEGWGLTNIEANSVGTAVIAADSPGLRDSVKDSKTGFLYEYGNIDQLADKLLLILKDQSLRKKLEQGALEWAERFNWDHAATQFESLLQEIVGVDK